MTHWIEYLPEAGRPILIIADGIKLKHEKIKAFKKAIKDIELEISEAERGLDRMMEGNWTELEVQKAKHEAQVYNSINSKS